MKKLICLLIVSLALVVNVNAKNKVNVYIFTQEGEEISSSAVKFFKELKESDDYGELFNYKEIEVWSQNWDEDYNNRKLADKVASYFDEMIYGAPYIVIGNKYHLSTYTEEYQDEIIEAIEKASKSKKYEDLIEKAKKEIKKQRAKDAAAVITIPLVTIIVVGGFIIIARKNND
jgi:TRAP-type C4-dicarboxylate transport system substrate-binding protein